MTTPDVKLAHTTKLKIGNGASPEVFTELLQVFDGPNGPDISPNMVTFTHHSSDWEVKKAGVKKSGQVTGGIYYDGKDTQHKALKNAANGITRTNFKEEMADGTSVAFAAYVSVAFSNADGDAEKCSFTLDIDGAVTITDPT